MKKPKLVLILFYLIFLFFITSDFIYLANAASPTPPCDKLIGGLVPCGRECDDPSTVWNEKASCNLCSLVLVIQLIIEFLVRLSAALALIAIIFGGFLYTSSLGSEGNISKAKSMIKYTLTGFLIILIAWAITDSILTSAGYIDPMEGKWYNMNCELGSVPTPNPSPNPTSNPIPTPNPTPATSPTPSGSVTPTPITTSVLRGVNWSGWTYGVLDGLTKQKLTDLKSQWNINILRFTINRYDYLNDSSYKQTVKDVTNWSKSLGITIIISQVWEANDGSELVPLPNTAGSVALWTNIAQDPTYQNDPLVWFGIWGEHHDVPMSEIRTFYDTVITEIRKYANNVSMVAGPEHAFSVRSWRGNYLTQSNVVYDCHMYAGSGSTSDLDGNIGVILQDGKEVFVGETAPYWEEPLSNGNMQWFKDTFLPWMDGLNRGAGIPTTKIGFTAWSMTDDPFLVKPRGDINSLTEYGTIIQNKLKQN